MLFVIPCRNNASGPKVFVLCETFCAASSGCESCTRAARHPIRLWRKALGESVIEGTPGGDIGEARLQMIHGLLECAP